MTRVVTSWETYGVYRDEALTRKPAFQFMRLTGTAANTDTAFDIGDFSGTFWGQVDDTATGLAALKALKDINTRAQEFQYITGLGINGKALIDSSRALLIGYDSTALSGGSGLSRTLVVTGLAIGDTILGVTMKTKGANNGAAVTKLDSAVSTGGSATETYTVTGLLTTDTILSVTQFVDGAGAAVGILSYGDASGNCTVNGQLAVVYNADPGANAKIRVAISRSTGNAGGTITGWSGQTTNQLVVTFNADPGDGTVVTVLVSRANGTTTPDAGTYQLTMNATNTKLPDVTFNSGNAPTTFDLFLAWVIKDGEQPVFDSAAA